MEQYISKSALVAEIEKRKHRNILNEGAFEEDIDILFLINTLEVKEVDLEKEVESLIKSSIWRFADKEDFLRVAKHFYELGLAASNKAQKGEEV